MSRARKTCLILDVAVFVGLGLFLVARYFREPRPNWSVEVPQATMVIGYSSANHQFYTLSDTQIRGSHRPSPRIQRWDAESGRMDGEYAVQIPEDELALFHPLKPGVTTQVFSGAIPSDLHVLFLHQTVPGPRFQHEGRTLFRMFDPDTGQRLFESAVTDSNEYYRHGLRRKDGHLLGLFTRSVGKNNERALAVRDLTESVLLGEFFPKPGQLLMPSILLDEGRYVAMVTRETATKSRPFILTIFHVESGEVVLEHELGNWGNLERYGFHLESLGGNAFYAYCMGSREGQGTYSIVKQMQFDPAAGKLEESKNSALYGVPQKGLYWIMGELAIGARHTNSAWWQEKPWRTIAEVLQRWGITLPNGTVTHGRYFYDLSSGQLLRQCTGLALDGLYPSKDGRLLVGVGQRDPDHPFLVAYPVHHFFWEYTWIVLLYGAWLLVLPWPLRIYLIRAERRRVNAGKAEAEKVISPQSS